MQKKIDTVKLKSLPGDDAQQGFFFIWAVGQCILERHS